MARDFPNSTASYLSVGDVAALDITGTALTIHCWARFDTVNVAHTCVAKWGSATNSKQYVLGINASGQINAAIGDATSQDVINGATALSTATWYSLAVRKNGTGAGALQGFVNGTSDASITSNRSIQNTASTFRVGNRDDNVNPHDGFLGEVAVWDVALSDAEISAISKGVSPLLIHPGSLKGYYPIWPAGSPESDLSGNKNNLTVNGTLNAANHAPVGPYAPYGQGTPLTVPIFAYVDSATVLVDLQASGSELAEYVDSAEAYEDIQPSGTDTPLSGAEYTDNDTAYFDLQASGSDVAVFADSGSTYVDLQGSGTEMRDVMDSATIRESLTPITTVEFRESLDTATALLDLDVSAVDCYFVLEPSWSAGGFRKWRVVGANKWSVDGSRRWTWQEGEGQPQVC